MKMKLICSCCRDAVIICSIKVVVGVFSRSAALERQSSERCKRGGDEPQSKRRAERDRDGDHSSHDSDHDRLSACDRQLVCVSLLVCCSAAAAANADSFKFLFHRSPFLELLQAGLHGCRIIQTSFKDPECYVIVSICICFSLVLQTSFGHLSFPIRHMWFVLANFVHTCLLCYTSVFVERPIFGRILMAFIAVQSS